MVNILSRRDFVYSAAAAFGGLVLPANAFGTGGKPLARFGVLSDVHINHPLSDGWLEKNLRLLDGMKVDAVIFPGDLSDTGHIEQLRRLAAVEEKVFPNGRAADGRPVKLMHTTGNHDIGQWPGLWKNVPFEKQKQIRFDCDNHEARVWAEIFHEPWELVRRWEVNGIPFVCSQWQRAKPPTERYFKEHAKDFDPALPFVYFQHAHPKGTCHGPFGDAEGQAADGGQATRALTPFANAIAFSGHSHIGPTDERAVWQGAFTSIGAGCAGIRVPSNFGSSRFHDNGGATYSGADMAKLMPPVVTGAGVWKDHEVKGSSAMMVELFKDHLIIHRISCYYGRPWGEDWCVPLPAAVEGPYDFKTRAATRKAPQFAADDTIAAAYCAKAPAWAGRDWRGKKPCVKIEFPTARRVETSRVFEYDVTVSAAGRELCRKKILSRGQHLPDSDMYTGEEVLFTIDEVPADTPVVFAVVPHDCYGTTGRPLVSKPFSWV